MKMKSPSPSIASFRKARLSSYFFGLLVALIILLVLLYSEDFSFLFFRRSSRFQPEPIINPIQLQEVVDRPISITVKDKKKVLPFAVGRHTQECDLFNGKWVKDESNRPLYQESECPYIQPQLTCQEHGRLDKDYQFWRWQPHGCDLARFNATFMLEKLRGKRMMFVGDSLNRGQYVSMVCLLHRILPEHAKSMQTFESLTVFRAEEYNASIEFYWAPFLLESNSDNAVIHRVTDRIVRKGSINKHGKYWLGADILVFNTYLWWITGMKMKILRGAFDEERNDMVEMETDDAYRLAMKSLVKWVQRNVDPEKSRVFFTGMSPSHGKLIENINPWTLLLVGNGYVWEFRPNVASSQTVPVIHYWLAYSILAIQSTYIWHSEEHTVNINIGRSIEWGGDPDGNCYNQTSPIEDPKYWGQSSQKSIMKVIGEVFNKSTVPITFLNITQLSEYRKDAHTSIYKKQWSPLTPEQIANPVSYSDCVHWCLPGLQDTWNELLYTKLFYP